MLAYKWLSETMTIPIAQKYMEYAHNLLINDISFWDEVLFVQATGSSLDQIAHHVPFSQSKNLHKEWVICLFEHIQTALILTSIIQLRDKNLNSMYIQLITINDPALYSLYTT